MRKVIHVSSMKRKFVQRKNSYVDGNASLEIPLAMASVRQFTKIISANRKTRVLHSPNIAATIQKPTVQNMAVFPLKWPKQIEECVQGFTVGKETGGAKNRGHVYQSPNPATNNFPTELRS